VETLNVLTFNVQTLKRSNVEEPTDLGGVEENLTVLDDYGQRPQMRALAWPADAESITWLIPCTVGVAHQVAFCGIPEIARLAVVEAHRQVTALVLIGPHLAVGHLEENTLLLERTVLALRFVPWAGIIDYIQWEVPPKIMLEAVWIWR